MESFPKAEVQKLADGKMTISHARFFICLLLCKTAVFSEPLNANKPKKPYILLTRKADRRENFKLYMNMEFSSTTAGVPGHSLVSPKEATL